MLKTGLVGAACAGLLLGALGAASADTLADVKQRGELVIATEMQFPPFDISDNGTYKGVDRDLIDEVGKELGVKVKYLDLPWTSVLPGLEAKKFDLCIAPVTISKERMQRYLFTVPIADATATPASPSPRTSRAGPSAARRALRSSRKPRPSPPNCPSPSNSRNMSTTTSPTPISRRGASTPRSIPSRTSPMPPRSGPIRSRW